MEVKLVNWFDDHWYRIDLENGETDYFKSVTSILGAMPKPNLNKWRGDVGNREADRRMNEAAEKGSNIHNAIDLYCRGGKIIYNPARYPVFSKEELNQLADCDHVILGNQQEHLEVFRFTRWFATVNPTVLSTEFIIYSLKHKYAGTSDAKMFIKGGKYQVSGKNPIEIPEGKYIIDYKTGNEDAESHAMQVAAYLKAEEEKGDKLTGAIIIYTNADIRTGIVGLKTVVHSHDELEDYFEKFLKVKAVDEFAIKTKPKVFELPTILQRS